MYAYQRAVPVLQVANVATSLRWYADVLGFTPDTFPKTPPYSFAILRRDGAEIMLQCADEARAADPSERKSDPEFLSIDLRISGEQCSTSLARLRRKRNFSADQNGCCTDSWSSRFATPTAIACAVGGTLPQGAHAQSARGTRQCPLTT